MPITTPLIHIYAGATPDPSEATRHAMQIAKRGMIPIVEVFYSLQGEGLRSGEATVFVRLAGCNCDCWFCDTDFRTREQHTVETLTDVINKIGNSCKWVCLTGGEPTIHDLQELCDKLHQSGYSLQIETNGSRPQPDWKLDHITVSPKVAEGAKLDDWYLQNAAEFKHVVTDKNDVEKIAEMSSLHKKPVSLQPNSLEPDAVQLCIDAVQKYPARFRLSLQTHKIIGVR
jgi:organic radical activating enzyme